MVVFFPFQNHRNILFPNEVFLEKKPCLPLCENQSITKLIFTWNSVLAAMGHHNLFSSIILEYIVSEQSVKQLHMTIRTS